jgi:hypothetical protein
MGQTLRAMRHTWQRATAVRRHPTDAQVYMPRQAELYKALEDVHWCIMILLGYRVLVWIFASTVAEMGAFGPACDPILAGARRASVVAAMFVVCIREPILIFLQVVLDLQTPLTPWGWTSASELYKAVFCNIGAPLETVAYWVFWPLGSFTVLVLCIGVWSAGRALFHIRGALPGLYRVLPEAPTLAQKCTLFVHAYLRIMHGLWLRTSYEFTSFACLRAVQRVTGWDEQLYPGMYTPFLIQHDGGQFHARP